MELSSEGKIAGDISPGVSPSGRSIPNRSSI
jgi:hypothetical protein